MSEPDKHTLEVPIPSEDWIEASEDPENNAVVLRFKGQTAEVMEKLLTKGLFMYAADRVTEMFADITKDSLTDEDGNVDTSSGK